MSGRRAPELAAGAVDRFVSQHLHGGERALIVLCMPLLDEQKAFILGDWSSAAARLSQFLEVKLGFWKVCPHRLAWFEEGPWRPR